MAKLFHNPDGTSDQARAVLAFLQSRSGIEPSWDEKRTQYLAEPEVERWHNCREQGYVISLRSRSGRTRQLNIAFFEHRNSDAICAVEWEQITLNPPTIADFPESHPYHDNKWAVSHQVSFGEIVAMTDWIMERLTAFWLLTENKNKNKAA